MGFYVFIGSKCGRGVVVGGRVEPCYLVVVC